MKGTITITGVEANAAARNADTRNMQVTFKNCALLTNCISEINSTQIDSGKDLDVVMQMFNVIEYSNNYAKTTGSLRQYDNILRDNITDSKSFKSKAKKITGRTPADGNTKDAKIAASLKYFSNFWRTLEMPLIIFEVNLIITSLTNCYYQFIR